jgi:hypothetical protein
MKKRYVALKAAAVAGLSALPYAALAVSGSQIHNVNIANTGGNFKTLAAAVINILLGVAAAIAVIILIIGGLRYLISAGDSGQIEKAKHTIQYAIIGLIVIIFAFVIYNTVNGLSTAS